MTAETISTAPGAVGGARAAAPDRTPVIFFLTSGWANIDDRIRAGEEPGGVPSVHRIWSDTAAAGFRSRVFICTDLPDGRPVEREYRGARMRWFPRPLPGLARWLHRKRLIGILKVNWLLQQVAMMRELRRACREEKPDVVYCMRSCFTVVGWLVARAHGARLVQRQFGTWAYHHFHTEPTFRNKLTSLGSVLAFKFPTDLFIMTNDGTFGDRVAEMAGFPPERFRFWVNGVERPGPLAPEQVRGVRERRGIPESARTILYVGRLARWKRVDRLIAALPSVVRRVPEALLVVAGDGLTRPDLEAQARELGVEEHVLFLGAVGHTEVSELYRSCDLAVFAHDLTNMTNTLLEALANGCPIVTYDVGSTTTIARDGENARVLPAAELPRLGDEIADLLGDAERRAALALAARGYAERHLPTWDERMRSEVDELLALADAPAAGETSAGTR